MTQEITEDRAPFYRNITTVPVIKDLRVVSTAAYKYESTGKLQYEYIAQVFDGSILVQECRGATRFSAEGNAVKWIEDNYTCQLPLDESETPTIKKEWAEDLLDDLYLDLENDIDGAVSDLKDEIISLFHDYEERIKNE